MYIHTGQASKICLTTVGISKVICFLKLRNSPPRIPKGSRGHKPRLHYARFLVPCHFFGYTNFIRAVPKIERSVNGAIFTLARPPKFRSELVERVPPTLQRQLAQVELAVDIDNQLDLSGCWCMAFGNCILSTTAMK